MDENVINDLSNFFSDDFVLLNYTSLSGGCINQVYKIETNFGSYVLKFNKNIPKDFFYLENHSLNLLSNICEVNVPKVVFHTRNFLLLEYINECNKTDSFFSNLGHSISELHKVTDHDFGLDHNNYIGSLSQVNERYNNWSDFFIVNRLLPLIELYEFNSSFLKSFDLFLKKIDLIIPVEKPSLLHGDLWIGNVINSFEVPYLIDPAVYYGHREMDLAMSKLFGGFHDDFYSTYNENYPLIAGWEDRRDIYNLYPLLVHLNLFGRSYYSQILTIVNKYT